MGLDFFPLSGLLDVWAPEWTFDAVAGAPLVFWAARGTNVSFYLERMQSTPCAAGANPQRFAFFAAHTSDFVKFERPFLLFDPCCNVSGAGDCGIDGDLVFDESGRPVFVYKDARGPNESVRGIRIAYSASGLLTGPYSDASEGNLLATLVEAPELVHFGDEWKLYFDCSFEPTPPGWPCPPYGVATSPHLAPANFSVLRGACSDTNPALGFPKGMTHGSFLCLTDEELAPVLAPFPERSHYV